MSLPLLRSTTYSFVVYQYTHSHGPINPVTTLFYRYGRPRTALVAVTSATPTSKFNPSTLRRGRRPRVDNSRVTLGESSPKNVSA